MAIKKYPLWRQYFSTDLTLEDGKTLLVDIYDEQGTYVDKAFLTYELSTKRFLVGRISLGLMGRTYGTAYLSMPELRIENQGQGDVYSIHPVDINTEYPNFAAQFLAVAAKQQPKNAQGKMLLYIPAPNSPGSELNPLVPDDHGHPKLQGGMLDRANDRVVCEITGVTDVQSPTTRQVIWNRATGTIVEV